MSRSRPTQPSDDPSQGCTYPRVNPSDIAFVEIFPPVGIARVGDSGTLRGARIPEREIEYFYTPEVPNHVEPPPDFKFRDKYQRIKRQVFICFCSSQTADVNIMRRPLVSASTLTTRTVRF